MPISDIARYLTQSPLRGALAGAGVGAAYSGMRAPEGERGGSMLRGALRGAAVGGTLSGLGRGYRDTRLLAPQLSGGRAVLETGKRIGKGVADSMRRQVHGFTGKYDPQAIGMQGSGLAARKQHLAGLRLQDDIRHAPAEAHAGLQAGHAAEVAALKRDAVQGDRLQKAGLTSLPGMYRAMKDPARRGEALRAAGSTVTQGGLGFGVGVPLLLSGPDLLRGDESAQGGHTVKHKLVRMGERMALGAATGGLPFAPAMAADAAADTGLGYLHGEGGIGYLRGRGR